MMAVHADFRVRIKIVADGPTLCQRVMIGSHGDRVQAKLCRPSFDKTLHPESGKSRYTGNGTAGPLRQISENFVECPVFLHDQNDVADLRRNGQLWRRARSESVDRKSTRL